MKDANKTEKGCDTASLMDSQWLYCLITYTISNKSLTQTNESAKKIPMLL